MCQASWCRRARHWSEKPASRRAVNTRLPAHEAPAPMTAAAIRQPPRPVIVQRETQVSLRNLLSLAPLRSGKTTRRQSRSGAPTCAAVRRARGSCAVGRVLTCRREPGFVLDGHGCGTRRSDGSALRPPRETTPWKIHSYVSFSSLPAPQGEIDWTYASAHQSIFAPVSLMTFSYLS